MAKSGKPALWGLEVKSRGLGLDMGRLDGMGLVLRWGKNGQFGGYGETCWKIIW